MDPLADVLAFPDPDDQELVAWVASQLAYGRVAPMRKAIRAALAPLGSRPALTLRAWSDQKALRTLSDPLGGWCWRFHTGADLMAWLLAWKALDREGGLEAHFTPTGSEGMDERLSALVQRLRRSLPETHGLRFSLPDPLEGAACKRWRMFLRWMVRPGWPDLGRWQAIHPSQLRVPLDTHVARLSRFLGFTRRTSVDGRMVAEVTDALRRLDPQDPLRFDFGLAHLGILGDCPGRRSLPGCSPCPLVEVCRAR